MSRLWATACVALGLLMSLGAAAGDPQTAVRVSDSPLSEWLNTLILPLGDINTHISSLNADVDLGGLLCTKTLIDSLGSSYDPPDKVTFDAEGIDLACNGTYDVSHPIFGTKISATGVIDFTINVNLKLGVTIEANNSKVPPDNVVPSTDLTTKIEELKFHASGGALDSFLINILTPVLKPLMPGFLDPMLTTTCNRLVSDNVTAIVNAFEEFLHLPEPAAPPPPTLPPDIILNFKYFPIIANTSRKLSALLGPDGMLSLGKIIEGMTNGTGVLAMDGIGFKVGPIPLGGLQVTFEINGVEVGGLGTISLPKLFMPTNGFFLDTEVAFEDISISVNTTLTVTGNAVGKNGVLVETVMLNLAAKNLSTGISLLTAFDLLFMLDINVYQIGQLACLPSILYMPPEIYRWNFSATDITTSIGLPGGELEGQVADLVNDVLGYFLYADGDVFPVSIERVLNEDIVPVINGFVSNLIAEAKDKCEQYPHIQYVDLMHSTIIDLLGKIDDQTIDKVVDAIVPGGKVDADLKIDTSLSLLGIDFDIRVGAINISGLNTFYSTSLLEPTSHADLRTAIGFGYPRPFMLRADLGFAFAGAPMTNFVFNTSVDHVHAAICQDLQIDDAVLNLTVSDIFFNPPQYPRLPNGRPAPSPAPVNVRDMVKGGRITAPTNPHQTDCYVADYVHNWNFSFTELEAGGFHADIDLEGNDLPLKEIVEELSPSLWQTLVGIAGDVPGTIGSSLNSKVQTLIFDAPYQCQGRPVPTGAGEGDTSVPDWEIVVLVVCLVWGVGAGIFWWGYEKHVQRDREIRKLVEESKFIDTTMWDEPRPGWTSLRHEFATPDRRARILQVLLPFLMLATIATKVWSLSVKVSRVKLRVRLVNVGEDLYNDYVIDFTFQNMVTYFWESGAYIISIVICAGSAILPLLVSAGLLASWFLPAKKTFRGKLLMSLTQLAKGSYIDVMFLCYVVLVLKQTVDLGGTETTITSEPVLGIYGGIVSSTMNVLLCHWLRNLHNERLRRKSAPTDARASLWGLLTTMPRRSLQPMVVFFLFVTACVLTPIVYHADITWFRLTGIAAELPGGKYDTVRSYGLYAMSRDLPANTDMKTGAVVIGAVYSFLVLVMPLVTLALWLCLWLVPLMRSTQRKMYEATLWCYSFSGFEMFWIASFAATLEINKVARWVLDHTVSEWCDANNAETVCSLILPYASSGQILHIDTRLQYGGWTLLCVYLVYHMLFVSTLYGGGRFFGFTSRGTKTRPDSNGTAFESSGAGSTTLSEVDDSPRLRAIAVDQKV